ncbi:sensor histidine kinase KdpD [Halobacillus sp. A5]|uniref:sensor histidine kinase n=1 Tax=Halobacillus sp. A5 TaxID=2880263 RepID=UPI0020A68167|nr:HAMP domain-containing sensor histidine kinase [Halobacillus sp. A5]MCP3029632.1 HAMP domain-containing histidine kinase [Halobacillus sp. A5]
MRNKLTSQFIFQHIFFLILCIILIGVFFFYLYQTLTQQEYNSDFTRANNDYIESNITIGNQVEFSEKIKENIRQNNGWLQVINVDDGRVVNSLETSDNVQALYSMSDLVNIKSGDFQSSYKYKYWMLNENLMTLYGYPSTSEQLLDEVGNEEVLSSSSFQEKLQKQEGWYLIYNETGDVEDRYNDPQNISKGVVFSDKTPVSNNDYDIATTHLSDNKILVLGVPSESLHTAKSLDNELGVSVLVNLGILLLCVIISLVLLSYYHARRWGIPIIYMLDWIENLANNQLEKPLDLYRTNKRGKIRFPRVFSTIHESLGTLTHKLQENKRHNEKLIQMREDWIAGLSHDLKTPLSSMVGYAVLLKSPNYEWSASEIQTIGNSLHSKGTYIQSLIEDLSLTYRLKYDSLPLQKENLEVASLLKEIIIEFLNHPDYSSYNVEFSDETENPIIFPMDAKWFKRIIGNLLANAVKHNETTTKIMVKLYSEKKEFHISVEDNGVGMDEVTVENLFTKYYRGTSTTINQEGSGLGLAITKQLVEAHNGKIEVISKKGVGTRIKLTFSLLVS